MNFSSLKAFSHDGGDFSVESFPLIAKVQFFNEENTLTLEQ
jgi:hypothetical protein